MHIRSLRRTALTAACMLGVTAAGTSYSAQPEAGWSYRTSAGYFLSTEADFDNGGEFSSQHFFIGGSTEKMIGRDFSIGLGLNYTAVDYDFDGLAMPLWDRADFLTLSIPLSMPAGERGRVSLFGSIGTASEQEADFDDGFVYSVISSYMYSFSKELSIGLGAGYTGGLEDNSLFPFMMIRWQITEQLLLTNPFRPGPFGPAGLELSYRPNDRLDFAIGGVYRSLRFALAEDSSTAPSGYAEFEGIPVFLRVGWAAHPAVTMDAYLGVSLNGELTIDDRDGHELSQDDYDPLPIIGLSISGRL